jgi:polyisoprenoid-binding protein YceI
LDLQEYLWPQTSLGNGRRTRDYCRRRANKVLPLDPLGGRVSREIVVDAKSGDSGSGMRDRKMHREILESERYPEIAFRPDRVQGTVVPEGKSTVQVREIFSIHGTDHESTVPADLEMGPDHWTATVHFTIPYVKWGMKNPSTLFLRVDDSVQIDLVAAGSLGPQATAVRGPSVVGPAIRHQ